MRISLLREAGGLGDVVMTEPVVRGLREKFPQAEIWYAGLPEYRETVELFAARPEAYFAVRRHERRDRDAEPDAARWPYLGPLLDADLTVSLFCPAFRHEKEFAHRTHLNRVELFCAAAGVEPSAPSLRLPAWGPDWARGFLTAKGWDGETGLVALAPWSCGKRRTWPKENWRLLAEGLRLAGLTPLVLHPFEGPVRDVSGIRAVGLTVPEVAALTAACGLAVANDSGILHLAAALGVPTLSLWGSTNPRVILERYQQAEFIYRPEEGRRPARCRPPCYSIAGSCDFAACRESCLLLDGIGVEEVLAGVLRFNRPGKTRSN